MKFQNFKQTSIFVALFSIATMVGAGDAQAQLTDQTQTPNAAGRGIALSLEEQIGAGQGDLTTPDSSLYIIKRDPARAVRRGRQLFQRKFTKAQGQGPRTVTDGIGGPIGDPNSIANNGALGAGLADSCALCHGQPRGSAGFGGDVVTRPDGRNAPHLFGLGLQEQLADEITQELRALRAEAIATSVDTGQATQRKLISKGIYYGKITGLPDGSVDTSQVQGVDPDLRVRPFFAQGGTISMREFIVGALKAEMGLEAADPCLLTAFNGGVCTTPAGMVLDGSLDTIEAPPIDVGSDDGDLDGVTEEIDPALVDFLEFYLLNYFKPGLAEQTKSTKKGLKHMKRVGCLTCHKQNLTINADRRIADVETRFDPGSTEFNRLFAEARTLIEEVDDGQPLPQLLPKKEPFVVKYIFTDFKRHDLGPNFHEINYDGTVQTEMMTEPLWGVGSTAPYGHDARSINLKEVILRHGGEALQSRNGFKRLNKKKQEEIIEFLETLILFPPDSTASNLNPGDPNTPGYPQVGHGSINLGALFQTPGPE
ncbi:MAG: hypothetical protein NPINA01_18940 [Nitrospinaceae bacterium]|nr:MAG: hypothetical protein NPINA01_18940 [Nitrospinaceae bacterium]